jgi:lysophospholipase L1-like esterase
MPKSSRPNWKVLGNIGLVVLAVGTAGAVASVALPGATPPPVSDKVAEYYSNPPTPTVKSLEPVQVTPLADINALVTGLGPLTVSVLGDSTGNDDGEWVRLWAQHLAADATVTVHTWKEGAAKWPAVTYGTGARTVTIWNGSMPGSNGLYARQSFAALQPQRPDLVIFNYGHNTSTSGTRADVETLQRMAQTRWKAAVPFAVTLQNASRGQYRAVSAQSVKDLRAWTSEQKIPVVDIESVIPAQNLDALLLDDVHPNQQGSKLWADKIIQTLG